MKKAIIFDLDGTLLDTLTDIMESVNNVLNKYNFPTHEMQAYKYFIGNGIEVLTRKAFPKDISESEFRNYFQEVKQEYELRQTLRTQPYKGIEEMLIKLLDKGISISILSNKPDEFAKPTVKHFFPNIKFDIVYGSRIGVERKPSPNAVFEILEKLRLKKEECYFVGDTAIDMQTAVNAGVDGIGVSWGFRTIKELQDNGSKYIINSPIEIFKLI